MATRERAPVHPWARMRLARSPPRAQPGTIPTMPWDALVLLLSCAAAATLTPLCLRVVDQRGWGTPRGPRRAHERRVPRLGGVCVFLALGVGFAVAAARLRTGDLVLESPLVRIGALALAMLALGLARDLRPMRREILVVGQLVLASLAWGAGIQIDQVEMPLGPAVWVGPTGSFVLTVMWIVALVHAFELIDGVDGLAAGLAIITSLVLYGLSGGQDLAPSHLGCLALAGALAGFVRYNLPPARICLGDAGAMTIGYLLAIFSILSLQKSSTTMVMAVPLVLAAAPILNRVPILLRRLLGTRKDPDPADRVSNEALGPFIHRGRSQSERGSVRAFRDGRPALFFVYGVAATLAGLVIVMRSVSSAARWGTLIALVGVGSIALPGLQRRLMDVAASRPISEPDAETPPPEVAAGPRRTSVG